MATAAEAFSFFADIFGVTTGLAGLLQQAAGGPYNPNAVTQVNQLVVALGATNVSANVNDGNFQVTCFTPDGKDVAIENNIKGANKATINVQLSDCPCADGATAAPATNCTIFPFGSDGSGTGLCIAGLTLTDSAGDVYSWSGDTWASCGFPYYPAGRPFGQKDGAPYMGACAIIDGTAASVQYPDGPGAQALSVNFSAFVNSSSPPSKQSLCDLTATQAINVPGGNDNWPNNVPATSYDPNPTRKKRGQLLFDDDDDDWVHEISIEDESARSPGNPLAADSPGKRMLRQRASSKGPFQNVNETRMVMSTLSGNSNSAKMLCSMPNSWGPDFVNIVEGYYCDMSTRTLQTLCPPPSAMKCMTDCWRWDGKYTMSHFMNGAITKTVKLYTSMDRHPSPLSATDMTLPGKCGSY